MSRHAKGKHPNPKRPKTKLGLPDLDHSKSTCLSMETFLGVTAPKHGHMSVKRPWVPCADAQVVSISVGVLPTNRQRGLLRCSRRTGSN